MAFLSAQNKDIHEIEKEKIEEKIQKLRYDLNSQIKIEEVLKNKPANNKKNNIVYEEEDEKKVAEIQRRKLDSQKRDIAVKIKKIRNDLTQAEKDLDREIKAEHYPYLNVVFRFTRRYPQIPLDLRFENTGGCSGPEIQAFYKETSRVMRDNIGTPMLCLTIDAIQKLYDTFQPKEADRRLRLEKEFNEELSKFKLDLRKVNPIYDLNDPGKWCGNITHLLKKLSSKVKVVNVENILRADLVFRFEKYRNYLRNKYLEGAHNKHQRVTCKWAESEVVFHGTRAENVGSIVEAGLQIPGQEDTENLKVKVASGSRYGLGIYTSPDINFSLHYTRGEGRLLVVAALPGRKFICNDSNVQFGGKCTPGYDSHQSHDNTELVLFKASAVLPCYVVHYKYTNHLIDKPLLNNDIQDSLNDPVLNHKLKKKKEQEELRAKAMKTLGYGFGPAGANFIVEAVYEAREIDEDLSNFQNMHEHQYQLDRAID
jgi:hypothetical protein